MSRRGLAHLPTVVTGALYEKAKRLTHNDAELGNRLNNPYVPVKELTWDVFGKWKSRQDLDLPGYNH